MKPCTGAGHGEWLSHMLAGWGASIYHSMKEGLNQGPAMCEEGNTRVQIHAFETDHVEGLIWP